MHSVRDLCWGGFCVCITHKGQEIYGSIEDSMFSILNGPTSHPTEEGDLANPTHRKYLF